MSNFYNDRRSYMAAFQAVIATILSAPPVTLFLGTMFVLAVAVLVLAFRIPFSR